MRKTVLVMTHTLIDHDSRIIRQVRKLSNSYNVILVCRSNKSSAFSIFSKAVTPIIFDSISVSNKLGNRFLKLLLRADGSIRQIVLLIMRHLFKLEAEQVYALSRPDLSVMLKKIELHSRYPEVDAIIANDVRILPFAVILKDLLLERHGKAVPLIGDMHEVHFNYGSGSKTSAKVRKWACNYQLAHCDQIISVSDEISNLYEKYNTGGPVLTIHNAPYFHECQPQPSGNSVRMVHIGGAQEERGIKAHIDLLKLLEPRFTLDLYLVSVSDKHTKHIEDLEQHIVESGLQERVAIFPPVASDNVVATLNQYDLGIYRLKPLSDNHKYSMPNKLFEYIQARLAIVVTPNVSMKAVVTRLDVGQASPDYELESFAKTVENVAGKMEYYKQKSAAAAKDLHADQEWEKLILYLNANLK